jgi:hypothetical protein
MSARTTDLERANMRLLQKSAVPVQPPDAAHAPNGEALTNWFALAILLACWSLETRLPSAMPRAPAARGARAAGAADEYYLAGYRAERWRAAARQAAARMQTGSV